MKIAIDFDGVICKRKGVTMRDNNFESDKPVKGAAEAMHWLKAKGHDVYVLTARDKDDHFGVSMWLRRYGFPDLRVTNTKEPATIYLDDRAIRFTNWTDFCKLF